MLTNRPRIARLLSAPHQRPHLAAQLTYPNTNASSPPTWCASWPASQIQACAA